MSLKSRTIHSIRPHCECVRSVENRVPYCSRHRSSVFVSTQSDINAEQERNGKKWPINFVAYQMHLLDTNKPIKSRKKKASEREIFMQFECIILLLSLEIITWQANECNEVRKKQSFDRARAWLCDTHTLCRRPRNGKTQSLNDLRGSQLK